MVAGPPAEAPQTDAAAPTGGAAAPERAWRYVRDGVVRYWPLYPFAALGLLIRWLAVTVWFPTCPQPTFFGEVVNTEGCVQTGWGDAFYFTTQGKLLADGHGFVNPTTWLLGATDPTIPQYLPGAGHPPMYSAFLGFLYKIGIDEPAAQRYVFPFIGALGVVLIGMAAWKIAGRRGKVVGMIAAGIAGTYPMLWINDFRYLSESIYIPMIAVLVMCLYRFWRAPSFGNAALVGAVLGVAGLTRGEGFFILACTVPPLLWGMRDRTWAWRIKSALVTGGVMAAVLAPWILYNVTRFDPPMLITSGTGVVLLHGSCDEAFYGPRIGYYAFECAEALPTREVDPYIHFEEEQDLVSREISRAYIMDNLSQVPIVALARVGRMWDLYPPAPLEGVELNDTLEQRGYWPSLTGLLYYWALLPFAVYGAVVLRRRKVPISPLLGIALAVTITAAASFGVTRYRVPVEVPLVMFAAVGIDAAIGRLRRRGASDDGEPTSSEDADEAPTLAAR